MDLRVLGRGARTMAWYQDKMRGYLVDGVENLEELSGHELKRHLASLQARGLAENTVHGSFEVIKAFCNWAHREGYPVVGSSRGCSARVRRYGSRSSAVARWSESETTAVSVSWRMSPIAAP
jgi:hypothetical protein